LLHVVKDFAKNTEFTISCTIGACLIDLIVLSPVEI
jgi:hypothetical protein